MNENERLKKIRTDNNLTLQQFGKKIGLSVGTISDMERGRGKITDRTVDVVCKEFRINREWLVNGIGEMYKIDSGDEIDALAKRYNLSYGIQVFIEKLVNSNEAAQNAVVDLIVQTAAAINRDPDLDANFRPKTFEEMSPDEIKQKVIEQRELEKRKEEGSDQSSSIA